MLIENSMFLPSSNPNILSFQTINYRPQRSCEGYVFTGVCLSTGGVSASVHGGILTPPEQTPPPQSRHHLPGADTTSQEQTPPQKQTPTPGADIPPRRHPPEQTPPQEQTPERRPLLRTVRILLECILVDNLSFCNHISLTDIDNFVPCDRLRDF